ncbi:12325_t:CDS:2, partial [Racocetra fulgida]
NQTEFNEEDEIESTEEDGAESNDEDKIVSNKENEELFETQTCEMLGQIYTTKKDILNCVQEIAQLSGFAVTVKSSGHRHFHLQCKRGGQPRNTSNLTAETRQKKRMSKHSKNARVFHEHRQLTQEAKHTAVQMLKAGAKPSTIYEAIRDENGEPTATRRDILNLSSRIYISEENSSMEALIMNMEKRGYTVRRETHKEIIIIDATYKTNVYKLPFVNFVGISNLGVNRLQTFGIAGAWISDESEKSYVWVVEQLASIVFFDIFPLVFVTDNDAALIGAFKKIFPQSEHLLCIWHVLNNFKKNLRKHFVDDSFDEIIKIVDRIIHLRDYEMLNLAIASYKKLAASSFNESAHSAMKRAIESSGSLTKLLLQYENESMNIDPLLTWDDKNRLKPLLGKVSQFALNKIKSELLSVTMYKACLCELRVNYNIPCQHMLPLKGPVELSVISKRWLLSSGQNQINSNYLMKDLSLIDLDNSLLKSRLYKIETQYMNFPDEQQRSILLQKLDNVLAVPETKLSEIKIPEQITGKGRPSGTKRLPIARQEMLLNFRIPADDVDQIYNPKSDGNCGFRALAIAIRDNEEN